MNDFVDQVKLQVNGMLFSGWKSARVISGIERLARDFTLEITNKFPGNADIARKIKPGDQCQLFIGGDLVLTGYVDATPVSYDAKNLTVTVKGRSKTADLVDCSAVNAPGQWRSQKLEKIAQDLASPYGVSVRTEVATGEAIADHTIQQGESVFESIDRLMRLRHVLATDNESGDLVFISVGSGGRTVTALELGKNIKSGSAELDYKNVFSEYICKGQNAGNDDYFGESAAGSNASVSDTALGRKRVLLLKQSGQADESTCQDRVDYERASRSAKAMQAVYTVVGWRQENGDLWKSNTLVRVIDPIIGFDLVMLIVEVSLVIDAQGMRAEITVGPQDGYITKAAKSAKKAAGTGDQWAGIQAVK